MLVLWSSRRLKLRRNRRSLRNCGIWITEIKSGTSLLRDMIKTSILNRKLVSRKSIKLSAILSIYVKSISQETLQFNLLLFNWNALCQLIKPLWYLWKIRIWISRHSRSLTRLEVKMGRGLSHSEITLSLLFMKRTTKIIYRPKKDPSRSRVSSEYRHWQNHCYIKPSLYSTG